MLNFPSEAHRTIDVICMGRANVDLYPTEAGVKLAQANTFVRHVGGSPANIAVGLSRLGAKINFIGAVSKDPFGAYVKTYLEDQGIDTTSIQVDDQGSRTSLAFAEVIPDQSDVLFYRNNASDLLLNAAHLNEDVFAASKSLLITGSSLSASPSREAILHAIDLAHRNRSVVFFDLDYRPSAWQDLQNAALYYNLVAEKADVVIGTREEFQVMNHIPDKNYLASDLSTIIERFLRKQTQLVVLKEGEQGAMAFTNTGDRVQQPAFMVKAIKPYGAGDAFAASLIYDTLNHQSLERAMRNAAAAAALVVTRIGCAEAMPTRNEIDSFIAHAQTY